jgi:outer membrane murein-binding lipoprotein Lpp
MRISLNRFRFVISAGFAGMALLMAGCTDSTTRDDVSTARATLETEQEETAEVIRQGEEDVAQAKRDAYEASKPVIEQGREDVAEVQREVSESIREQKKEEQAAAATLQSTEQQLYAKQERESYVKQVEHRLADMKLKIDELEERASKSDGTEKEELDLEIKALHAQHERAEEALEVLKSAELDDWAVHEQNVRIAMQDLDSRISTIR